MSKKNKRRQHARIREEKCQTASNVFDLTSYIADNFEQSIWYLRKTLSELDNANHFQECSDLLDQGFNWDFILSLLVHRDLEKEKKNKILLLRNAANEYRTTATWGELQERLEIANLYELDAFDLEQNYIIENRVSRFKQFLES